MSKLPGFQQALRHYHIRFRDVDRELYTPNVSKVQRGVRKLSEIDAVGVEDSSFHFSPFSQVAYSPTW